MIEYLKNFKNKSISFCKKVFEKLREKFARYINLLAFKFRDKLEKLFGWLRLYPEQVNLDRITFYVEEMMEELHNAGYELVYASMGRNGKPQVTVLKADDAKEYVEEHNSAKLIDVDMVMNKFVDKGDVYYPYLINKEHKDMYFLDDEFFLELKMKFGVKNDFSPFNEKYIRRYRDSLLETRDSRSWLPKKPKSPNDEL